MASGERKESSHPTANRDSHSFLSQGQEQTLRDPPLMGVTVTTTKQTTGETCAKQHRGTHKARSRSPAAPWRRNSAGGGSWGAPGLP